MRAGRLRHRLTWQRYTEAQGADGQAVRTWFDVCTVSAEVAPYSGDEAIFASGSVERLSHRITIRAHRQIQDARGRFRWRTATIDPTTGLAAYVDRYFEVQSRISVLENGREIDLQCVEVTSQNATQ